MIYNLISTNNPSKEDILLLKTKVFQLLVYTYTNTLFIVAFNVGKWMDKTLPQLDMYAGLSKE